MIASLEDAWNWYENANKMLSCMRRLGARHWSALPHEVRTDPRFIDLESAQVVDSTGAVLDNLDDLCIVLLFSVFESRVREQVLDDIDTSVPSPVHPAVERAVGVARENVDSGSFYRVLECYKKIDAGLVEEVNQVRKYRNWVAHGRRGPQPDSVTPPQAYKRLGRFWSQLISASNDSKSS